jgi:hypothetical protein
MSAERSAQDPVGEQRGALGRPPDLLVRDHLLDLDQGAVRGAPQEPIGVAGAHELHVAVGVGLRGVEQRHVRRDGGHRDQRLAADRVGEELEIRVHLGVGGAHPAPGGHEGQHLTGRLQPGIVLPLVALPDLDLPALGGRAVEGPDGGQGLRPHVGADDLAHAPGPDEQVHVEPAHRGAHHREVAQPAADDVADADHGVAGGGEAPEGDAHAVAEPRR